MAKTETQVAVRVTNKFKERLEEQAKREDRSVANIVRRAVEEYLNEKEKEAEM